jgi:hypothetical protein
LLLESLRVQLAVVLFSINVILPLSLDPQFSNPTELFACFLFNHSHSVFEFLDVMLLFDILLCMADGVVEAEKFVAGEADSLNFAVAAIIVAFA